MKRAARRGGVIVALMGILCLLLTGCSAVTTLIDTSQALRDAGYQSVSVGFHLGSGDEVDVSVKVAAEATNTNARDVAHIVWEKFHERFQLLHVTVHGSASSSVFRVYSYQDLVSMFGARNPAWDRRTISSATTRLGAVIVVGLVVAGAVVTVVVVVVSRRKRRRRGGGHPGGSGWSGEWRPAGGPPTTPAHRAVPDPLWPPPQGPPPGRPPAPAQGSSWGSPPRSED